MLLSPSEIYFTHDTINSCFICGRLIENTYKELRDREIRVSVIPRMTVTDVDGEWFAWNGNRRLWVFKKLEAEGRLQKIKVEVTDEPIPRKRFTTQSNGRSVEVRGRSDLAFPPQGPMKCARFDDDLVKRAFFKSVTSSTLSCLALPYDNSGYFYITKKGGWGYRGIPSNLAEKISEKKSNWVNPRYVALWRDECYFVKFDDGSSSWRVSGDFTKAVKKLGKRDSVQAVAFAPDGGWWFRTSKGFQWWDGLPEDLEEVLQDADTCANFVSVNERGDAWFVQFDESTHWQGLDEGGSAPGLRGNTLGSGMAWLCWAPNDGSWGGSLVIEECLGTAEISQSNRASLAQISLQYSEQLGSCRNPRLTEAPVQMAQGGLRVWRPCQLVLGLMFFLSCAPTFSSWQIPRRAKPAPRAPAAAGPDGSAGERPGVDGWQVKVAHAVDVLHDDVPGPVGCCVARGTGQTLVTCRG
eukprot:Skav216395  [mRNA]  locus=scaffold457:190178:196629:+ [translate_table: standard]